MNSSIPSLNLSDLNHALEDGFDYLSEPNENLICPICCNPFVDPVMCESTDHVFCRICLIKSLEISSTCPIDRLPLSLSLVAPAPKVLVKLVDELLVACPFKHNLHCSFVCQRDLMAAHVRSHQTHCPRPSPIAQQQALAMSAQTYPLDQHPSSRPSSPLFFEWRSGRATLVEDHQFQTVIPSDRQKLAQSNPLEATTPCFTSLSPIAPADTSEVLERCPFEQFGCQFIGKPEFIKHKHLSATPSLNHLNSSSDSAHCPFSFVQDILKSFQTLERRNNELKQQLSRSLVKQDELVSVIQNLKSSLRQLWLSQPPSMTDPIFAGSSAQAPPLVKSPRLVSLSTAVENTSSLLSSDSCTLPRRSSDGSLPIYSSRLNYDTSNGNRLKPFNHPLPSHSCQFEHFSNPPNSSNSSILRPNIRVSTFVRKGKVITPTTPSITSFGSDQLSLNSSIMSSDPSSKSDSSTRDQLEVNSLLINPQIIQMIETIHKHFDSKQQNQNMTASPIQAMKILDSLTEVKNLLGNLTDQKNDISTPKKVQQQSKLPEINPESLASSSSSKSSFKL